MDTGLTASDVALLNRDNNNGWGDNGFMWIFALLILFWGGNGNFLGGNNGAITEAQMCNMNNFQQLENAVGRLSDSQAQQNMMIQQGMCSLGYQNLEQFSQLGRDLCTGFANSVATTNQAAFNIEKCCCETNRNIDNIRYENAMNTSAINANIDAKFAALEKNQLEQTIAAQQSQINQLQLQAQLCGVVRYPNATTFSAGVNPFFNSGCNCGC